MRLSQEETKNGNQAVATARCERRGMCFIDDPIISQATVTTQPAVNTAGAPKYFANHPPPAPPANKPIACMVLYTPRAAPRPDAGAKRDTSEG